MDVCAWSALRAVSDSLVRVERANSSVQKRFVRTPREEEKESHKK